MLVYLFDSLYATGKHCSPGEFTSNRFLKRVGCFVFRLRLSGLSPSCHSAPRKRDSGTRSMMTHFVRHSSPGEFTSNRFLKRSRLFCFSASAIRVISFAFSRGSKSLKSLRSLRTLRTLKTKNRRTAKVLLFSG